MGSMCRSSSLKTLLFKESWMFKLSLYFCQYFLLIIKDNIDSFDRSANDVYSYAREAKVSLLSTKNNPDS